MRFAVHEENSVALDRRHVLVPGTLVESRVRAMDLFVYLCVGHRYLSRCYAYERSVLLMERMHMVDPPARDDSSFERQFGEASIDWTRNSVQWIPHALYNVLLQ